MAISRYRVNGLTVDGTANINGSSILSTSATFDVFPTGQTVALTFGKSASRIDIGQSCTAVTIGNGVSANHGIDIGSSGITNGISKTITIGANGTSGSSTVIRFGSAVSGSNNSTTIYGQLTLPGISGTGILSKDANGVISTVGSINTTQTITVAGIVSCPATTITNNGTLNTTWNGASSAIQMARLGVGGAAPATTGEIYAYGDITAFASDERIKTNIKPILNAVEKVCSLKGVTYKHNELGESFGFRTDIEYVGLLAQDVAEVLPQAVALAPFDVSIDGDIETSKSGEYYLTVKYDKIVALLVEAIKEQQKQIDDLKLAK